MNLATFTSLGLPLALALIMLSMGLSLHVAQFSPVIRQPRAVLIGLFGQLICVPVLGFLIVLGSGLTGALAVGLMVLSFSPGGTTSNLFSMLAKGDVPLSISLTAFAGFLTPISLPLFTAWALQWQSVDAIDIIFPVALTIVRLVVVMLLPLALGMVWRQFWSAAAGRGLRIVRPMGIGLFSCVIAAMVIQRWPVLGSWLAQLGGPVLMMIVLALLLGWGLARVSGLGAAQCKTISIEVGMQNGGTALLITQGVLNDAHMSSVPLLYGLMMLIPVLFMVWSGRREKT